MQHCKVFMSRLRIKHLQRVSKALFHHQIATCTENVKFREVNIDSSVNIDLLPGTGSGK